MFMEIEDEQPKGGSAEIERQVQGQRARDLVAEARALLTKCAPSGKITNGADAYLFDMRGPALLSSLCDEVEHLGGIKPQCPMCGASLPKYCKVHAKWEAI